MKLTAEENSVRVRTEPPTNESMEYVTQMEGSYFSSSLHNVI